MPNESMHPHLLRLLHGEDEPEIKVQALQEDFREASDAAYLESLRAIMRTPDGLRVLWHWMQAATAPGGIFVSSSAIYKNAALEDYRQDREMEMAMADPETYQHIQLEAARATARLRLLNQRKEK